MTALHVISRVAWSHTLLSGFAGGDKFVACSLGAGAQPWLRQRHQERLPQGILQQAWLVSSVPSGEVP